MNMISLPSVGFAAGASRFFGRNAPLCSVLSLVFVFVLVAPAMAAPLVRAIVGDAGREQRIDGFGTCTYAGDAPEQAWFQDLYFGELRASILRVDLTPRYQSPYSDWTYNSPWFHNNPPLPGPENNNVRTYTGPNDYSREFAGKRAPIAVMGPDIETNIAVFDYENELPHGSGTLARAGTQRAAELGGFKLLGCFWSPAPWVKIASGNVSPNYGGILPTAGTPWPYIWADNFAGGKLDISNTPLEVFNDGTGPTSALTQYARSCAAYILGYQRHFGVKFYAISLQNEPGFEQFYNSAKYQLSSEYIAALKALRAEFDRHAELRDIVFSGTDDLLGEDAYGLWQYGGGASIQHKNLQFVANIEADPAARAALQIYSIHGYAANGVNAANADPVQWTWWADGWTESPAPGVPAPVAGFAASGKRSWMTETSGEDPRWLWPASGFPGSGAWSVALRIHQALTAGRESAWLYWQMADGDTASHSGALTGSEELGAAPKFNAAKHFFRYIRPGAQRVDVAVDDPAISASAYVHDGNQTITYVLLNTSTTAVAVTIAAPSVPSGINSFDVFTSSDGSYWVPTTSAVVKGKAFVTVPGYGVVTVVGRGTSQSIFADGLASGWLAEKGAETKAVTHWQSDRALSLASDHREATLKIVHRTGAAPGENDLLEFYVRAPERGATLEKIGFRFAGSKHVVTAKHNDLYVDDRPVRGRKIAVPNDGAWHKVTVDLDGLRPRRGANLSAIEIQAGGRQQVVVDDIVMRSL
jgi:O-glycosyl hydrolase